MDEASATASYCEMDIISCLHVFCSDCRAGVFSIARIQGASTSSSFGISMQSPVL